MNQRDYDGKAEEYLAECLRIEIEKKDAEIASLKERIEELEDLRSRCQSCADYDREAIYSGKVV